MNTANVMAVNVQASAKAGMQSAKATTKAAKSAAQSKNSFDDTLGKLSDEGKETFVPDELQGSKAATSTGTSDADVSADEGTIDPLAANIAAAENAASPQDNAANATVAEDAEPSVATMALTVEPNAQPQMSASTVNLQSLLPQSDAETAKGQDLLTMLSGQQLQGARREAAAQQLGAQALTPVATEVQTSSESQTIVDISSPLTLLSTAKTTSATILEAQLASNQTTLQSADASAIAPSAGISTTADAGAELSQALSVAAEAASDTVVDTIPTRPQVTAASNITDIVDSSRLTIEEQPVVQPSVGQRPEQAAMPGNEQLSAMNSQPVAVDEAATEPQTMAAEQVAVAAQADTRTAEPRRATLESNVAQTVDADSNSTLELDSEPLRVAREAAMDNSAMGRGNSEGESNGQQFGSRAATIPAATESESTASTTTTNANGQVSLFQQSLQESITGTGSVDSVQQNQQTQDSYEITRQIVDQARLIRRGEDTQMVIKLNPEHLGELTLKVSVTANGSVNASFHSDNATVRTIIENSLVQLKQELNEQGLKVDSVDVYAALDGGLPQDQGQQAWQNGDSNQSNYRGIAMDAEDYEAQADDLAAVATEAAGTGVATADGVDYRV